MNEIAKRNLPAYQDLVSGDIEKKEAQNELNKLLNMPPAEGWLKQHPTAANVRYIPIERVEWLLTKLFIKWWVDIRQVQVIANSVVVTIRLNYQDVLTNEVLYQDGIGAAPIQTNKGAGAMDWNATKNDAVMKAAPAAESYAVKDAAEKIGKIFGKDMNRADKIVYSDLAHMPAKEDKLDNLINEDNDQQSNSDR
jgi:hypothetical protein